MQADVWTTRDSVRRLTDDMAGYDVEGDDGTIGKVDRVAYSGNYVYVSTGRFMKHRYVIPAGAVERIDRDGRSLVVAATREEVEGSPVYDYRRGMDDESERNIGHYYSDLLGKRASAEQRSDRSLTG